MNLIYALSTSDATRYFSDFVNWYRNCTISITALDFSSVLDPRKYKLNVTIHIQNCKPLQIPLLPLRRGHVVLLLEVGVEDGLALESGAGCDARWMPRVKKQLNR